MDSVANLIIIAGLVIWFANSNPTDPTSGSLLESQVLPTFEGSINSPNISLLDSNILPTFNNYQIHSNPYRSKTPPQDVVNYLTNTIKVRYPSVPVWVYLAICYHERGIKNWRDNHLCGYGSYDGAKTGWKSSNGWKYQIDNLARIIHRDRHTGRFQGANTGLTCHEYQMFAKHSWKTTDWQNHCKSATYAQHFKRVLGLWN
jgi:hypothetical protein